MTQLNRPQPTLPASTHQLKQRYEELELEKLKIIAMDPGILFTFTGVSNQTKCGVRKSNLILKPTSIFVFTFYLLS